MLHDIISTYFDFQGVLGRNISTLFRPFRPSKWFNFGFMYIFNMSGFKESAGTMTLYIKMNRHLRMMLQHRLFHLHIIVIVVWWWKRKWSSKRTRRWWRKRKWSSNRTRRWWRNRK